MAFIDTDEFLVLRDGTPDLPTVVSPAAQEQQRRLRAMLQAIMDGGEPLSGCSFMPCTTRCLHFGFVQLQDYMGHGGLVVNWQVFGSGGLKVRRHILRCCGALLPAPVARRWQHSMCHAAQHVSCALPSMRHGPSLPCSCGPRATP